MYPLMVSLSRPDSFGTFDESCPTLTNVAIPEHVAHGLRPEQSEVLLDVLEKLKCLAKSVYSLKGARKDC